MSVLDRGEEKIFECEQSREAVSVCQNLSTLPCIQSNKIESVSSVLNVSFLSQASKLAHTVRRSADYSWVCEEGLKKIMKNVLTNLKVETSSVVVTFKSSSSRF